MNTTIELLKSHRSIRRFTNETVSDDLVHAVIEAAGWAATSNFIQAYSVIKVTDMDIRRQIADLTGPQIWVEKCPVFLVFCADLKRAQNSCHLEKKEMDSGYIEQFIIATVDVALAAQNAMIAAESLGLGGVFIGGIRNDPEKVCRLLKIPDHVYPVFGMCLGYPDGKEEQKPRLPVNVVLSENAYQDSESELEHYNEICSNYYQSRKNSSREDTWTRQIARMVAKPARPHMKEFLQKRGFNLK